MSKIKISSEPITTIIITINNGLFSKFDTKTLQEYKSTGKYQFRMGCQTLGQACMPFMTRIRFYILINIDKIKQAHHILKHYHY